MQDRKRIRALPMNEPHSFWELALWCLGEQEGVRKCRVGRIFKKKKTQTILSHSPLAEVHFDDPEPSRRG